MSNKQSIFEISLEEETVLLRMHSEQYATKHVWDTMRHCHAEYELHIILGGSCRVDVEDDTYALQTDTAILIAPGQYHQPMELMGEFSRFTLSLSTQTGRLLRNLRSRVPVCGVFAVDEQIVRLCNEIFQESAAGNAYKSEQLQALLTLLIVRVFRQLQMTDGHGEQIQNLTDLERITYIDHYFENHFADNGGEEALAKSMSLSKRQLARVLQKHYGMGYRQKLICARMDRAAWLLRTSDRRIGQIAETVGYISESAFFQVFRRHFRMTPQQYRKQSVRK